MPKYTSGTNTQLCEIYFWLSWASCSSLVTDSSASGVSTPTSTALHRNTWARFEQASSLTIPINVPGEEEEYLSIIFSQHLIAFIQALAQNTAISSNRSPPGKFCGLYRPSTDRLDCGQILLSVIWMYSMTPVLTIKKQIPGEQSKTTSKCVVNNSPPAFAQSHPSVS